jgi:hypothetical protein
LKNEIIRISGSLPTPQGVGAVTLETGALRAGWYLVAGPAKTQETSLMGPFPSRVTARFIGTSAQSLGLLAG